MNDDSVQMAPFTNMPADVEQKRNPLKMLSATVSTLHLQVHLKIILASFNLKQAKLQTMYI
jgi:hypothetical protein